MFSKCPDLVQPKKKIHDLVPSFSFLTRENRHDPVALSVFKKEILFLNEDENGTKTMKVGSSEKVVR